MNMQMSTAAATVAPVDPLVALLVGAFGAALLTVIGGLIGAWIQSIREHRKWLREVRFEAYHEFAVDMAEVSDIFRVKPFPEDAKALQERVEAWRVRSDRSNEALSILGPQAVDAAGQYWLDAATTYIRDRSEENKAAMGEGRRLFLIAASKELRSSLGDDPAKARPS